MNETISLPRTPKAIDLASLDALFRPRSVAVIGASANAGKIGGLPIHYLKRAGYDGDIYPINPRRTEIQGLKSWPSLAAVPAAVDLAVIAVPAAQVREALLVVAAKGTKSAIIFSAGFAELGADGVRLQDELAAIGRKAGIRLLGPNCSGYANFANGAWVTFAPLLEEGQDSVGNVGLVSQSGAFANFGYRVGRNRGIRFSQWLTTGNTIDVDIADGLAFLAADENTKVILVYMEGCADGARFIEALALARARRKPVVVVKVGTTEAGAAAVSSHTAALAGEDSVFDAVLRQYGAYRARSVEELFDIGYAAANGTLPNSAKIAITSISGGVGVLLADEAATRGLDIAPMPEPAQAALRELVPFAGTRNPVDVTAQVINDFDLFDRSLEVVLQQGDYDMLVCFMGYLGLSKEYGPRILPLWESVRRRHPERTLAVATLFDPAIRQALEEAGHLVFEEPTHAVRALAALRHFAESFGRADGAAVSRPPGLLSLPAEAGPLNELDSLAIVQAAGIPTIGAIAVGSAEEATQAFRRIDAEGGRRAVLKVVSRELPHKSEAGGVRLGICSEEEAGAAYSEVMARVAQRAPGIAVDGALVAPMAEPGIETIIGVHRDPVFGPVVMFGLGGVFAEVLRDVAFRVAPFDVAEARRMIAETKASAILAGARGGPAVDVGILAQALADLSRFASAHAERVESIDINPFSVGPTAACALDAVVVLRGE
ncbi:acetate--CoA ligase family protein [Oceanibacterium hippocampi]|uniref:Succinyl-CoA synthetase subunit alpha n=1 Tax=Oceanibacterium hippocampi TaxID=745714 RepID=A0A1Y5TRS8_9PROT|nr:acetate--CoA ligase family protein [Oceanibacterium hippocampi]SLN70680.1 succinyl-CoA synthetase subunit alpha [Oceanibacterium hippocampi]